MDKCAMKTSRTDKSELLISLAKGVDGDNKIQNLVEQRRPLLKKKTPILSDGANL
jgi:hypothetical protein